MRYVNRELSDGPVIWSVGIFSKYKANYAQARQNLIDHISRYSHTKGLDSVWFIQAASTAVALDATPMIHGQKR